MELYVQCWTGRVFGASFLEFGSIHGAIDEGKNDNLRQNSDIFYVDQLKR